MTQLIALSDYEAPSMPAEDALRKVVMKLRQRLGLAAEGPVLQQGGLERASPKWLEAASMPPVWIHDEALAEGLRDWLQHDAPDSWVNLLVVPPCGPAGRMEDWASAAGHQVLPPPQRHELTATQAVALPDMQGAGLLVIPCLEHWFIRQCNGLHTVRSLLAQLATLERHCLVACNSWAWSFLVKSVGADALLPRPRTLAALDAAGLQKWFAAYAIDDSNRPINFRLAKNGQDVLETNVAGALESGHLQQLAARSLGIPWVARDLWRASLHLKIESADLPERASQTTANDARTVWVSDLDDGRLPHGHEDRALLVLQALLIHDALTVKEIEVVLPATGEPDVLPALLAGGFVQREAGLVRVRATAYPAVRKALRAAGFPSGRM